MKLCPNVNYTLTRVSGKKMLMMGWLKPPSNRYMLGGGRQQKSVDGLDEASRGRTDTKLFRVFLGATAPSTPVREKGRLKFYIF